MWLKELQVAASSECSLTLCTYMLHRCSRRHASRCFAAAGGQPRRGLGSPTAVPKVNAARQQPQPHATGAHVASAPVHRDGWRSDGSQRWQLGGSCRGGDRGSGDGRSSRVSRGGRAGLESIRTCSGRGGCGAWGVSIRYASDGTWAVGGWDGGWNRSAAADCTADVKGGPQSLRQLPSACGR